MKCNMALLAEAQGNLEQPLELFTESTEISKNSKALGKDHQVHKGCP